MGNFSNYWDLTTLFTKIKNKLKSISDKIDDSVSLKTATGNPITLTDAANANAEELLMTIEPVQSGSGDPSPTNVRPISGLTEGKVVACGKNLFSIDSNRIGKDYDDETVLQRFFQTFPLPKGTYTWKLNGTVSGLSEISCGVADSMLPFSNLSAHTSRKRLTDQSPTNTITITDEFAYAFIGVLKTSGALTLADIELAKLQLEYGSTATDYEAPVTPANATITFGQTVYGGSVNFKTGEVTVTHKLTTVGALSWATQVSVYANFYTSSLTSEVKKTDEEAVIKSDIYVGVSNRQPSGPTAFSIYVNIDGQIKVNDRRYSTVNEWLADCASAQILYELETPLTLTLTPAELELLKGNNTITANGAEISIEYYPDNAIGALAERVDKKADITYVDNAVATKANTADVNTALAGKADITTVTIPVFAPSQAGWRRICKIKPIGSATTVEGMIHVGGNWSNGQPSSALIAVNIMYSTASLTLLSSAVRDGGRMTDMRLIYISGADYWLDVYFPAYSFGTGPLKLIFTGDTAVSDIQNPISITTDSTAASAEISLNQNVSGTVLTDKSDVVTKIKKGSIIGDVTTFTTVGELVNYCINKSIRDLNVIYTGHNNDRISDLFTGGTFSYLYRFSSNSYGWILCISGTKEESAIKLVTLVNGNAFIHTPNVDISPIML